MFFDKKYFSKKSFFLNFLCLISWRIWDTIVCIPIYYRYNFTTTNTANLRNFSKVSKLQVQIGSFSHEIFTDALTKQG